MLDSPELTPETTFLIDFNLHRVPAALGLAVPDATAAVMLGISPQQFSSYVQDAETRVRRAALDLLAEAEVASVVDAWPVQAGAAVMAIGDSITTYRYGYARLLAAMLELRRPADAVRFLNMAESGYTSTHGLETTYTQFLAQQPDWVLIKFGVNDCKRFGGPQAKTLVSGDEYRANLAGIVDAFQRFTTARIILLTPTPVVEETVNTLPDFDGMRMTWSNQDLAARADAIRSLGQAHGLPVVDIFQIFGLHPAPDLFLPDGLHPNLAGHRMIARQVLPALV